MDLFEQRLDGIAVIVAENTANTDRIDSAQSSLAQRQNNGVNTDLIQALMSRIDRLEQAQHSQSLTEQEIAKYRAKNSDKMMTTFSEQYPSKDSSLPLKQQTGKQLGKSFQP